MNIRVGDLVTYRTYAGEEVPALVMRVDDDGAGYLPRSVALEIRYPNGDIRHSAMIEEGYDRHGAWMHSSSRIGLCAVCERRYVLTRRGVIACHLTPGTTREICAGSGLAPLAE